MAFEIAHLIARLRRVEHLEEDNAVDRHHGIVLGDDLLARHIHHLLHDVELAADAIDERDDEAQAWLERLV